MKKGFVNPTSTMVICILMVLQSCASYTRYPVPIRVAIGSGPVKVVDIYGNVYHYQNIIYDNTDSVYLGINGSEKSVIFKDHYRNGVYPIDSRRSKKRIGATVVDVVDILSDFKPEY